MPTWTTIIKYWSEHCQLPNGFIVDIGEPTCCACGNGFNGRYDSKGSDKTPTDLARRWEESPIQRAHAIPDSCGGSPTPENIAPLCRKCHASAPDTSDAEGFWAWCRRRKPHWKQDIEDFMECMPDDVTEEEIRAAVPRVSEAGDLSWHFGQQGVNYSSFGVLTAKVIREDRAKKENRGQISRSLGALAERI